MPTRRYDMTGRDARVSATRTRAVAAACSLLSEPDCRALTLESVAAASGVTRVTMYNHFGGKQALLLAVFRELGRRMKAERIQAAMRLGDPRAALGAVLDESSRAWLRQRVAVKRLLALAALDPDIGRAVERAERDRRASLGYLARRLAGAGQPRLLVSAREATLLLGALTSFEALEALAAAGTGQVLLARLERLAHAALGISGPRRPASRAKQGAPS